jgi:N-acetylglucosamine-6-phosphate deacetylase
MKTVIEKGNVITPQGIMENGSLLIEDGVIKAVSKPVIEIADAIHIDVNNKYVSPGFIDLHVHGGGGCDFMDGTTESFLTIAATHLSHGTTAMMPTTLSSTRESIHGILDCYEKARLINSKGAKFLGVHIEGPYFAMAHRGAQDPRYMRNPDKAEYSEILNRHSCIKRWSVAPELEGALEFGKLLASKKIIPSIAHTDAVYSDVEKAVANGYSLVTHLYSAMNGVVRRNAYRYAGTVEAAFLMDELDVEIIADGKHLPVPLLQLIYKIKGADKICLITDAMRAAGTDVTQSILGKIDDGIPVIIEDDVAKLQDCSSFAGSIATADRLVRVMWKEAGINLADVIKMMCTTPARIAGVQDSVGSIVTGKNADIVIFDDSVNIESVFIKGQQMI